MELKFRAWDTTRSIMVKVEELNFIGEEAKICDKEDNEEYYHFSWLNIMQYTGLKDRNGKEIYEGDIVKYNETKYKVSECWGFVLERLDNDIIDYEDFPQCNYPAGSDETEFSGCLNDYCVSFFELACNEQDFEGMLSCEIIGNIYENKEMMEGFEI